VRIRVNPWLNRLFELKNRVLPLGSALERPAAACFCVNGGVSSRITALLAESRRCCVERGGAA